jgi:DNA-binding NarL/FixJ family response regulator
MYRYGLRTLLEATPDLEVVGEAATGVEAVTAAAKLKPDIVVMDLNMPGLNGIDATRAILGVNPGTGVLVLTMFDDDESVFAAMRAAATSSRAPTRTRSPGPPWPLPAARRSSARRSPNG